MKKLIQLLAIMCLMFLLTNTVVAQDADQSTTAASTDSKEAIQSLSNAIKELFAGYGSKPKMPDELNQELEKFAKDNANILSLMSLQNVHQQEVDEATKILTKSAASLIVTSSSGNEIVDLLAKLPGSDYSPGYDQTGGTPRVNITDKDQAIDIANLLNPLVYTEKFTIPDPKGKGSVTLSQSQMALNTVMLIGGLGQPLTIPTPKEIAEQLAAPGKASLLRVKLAQIRTFAALNSIVFYNLYHSIVAREPNLKLPDGVTIPGPGGKSMTSVSQLQLEDYLANHRIADPKWKESMQNANPLVLQHEMVLMQAEQLSQMQKLNKSIEMLNTTMTGLLAANLIQQKQMPPLSSVQIPGLD